MKKRILALLLTGVMLLGMVPAIAVETEELGGEPPVITGFAPLEEAGLEAAAGTAPEDLPLPETVEATVARTIVILTGEAEGEEPTLRTETQTGEEAVAVSWSCDSYDPDRAGDYTFTAFAEGYALAEGIAWPTVTVTLTEAGDAEPYADGDAEARVSTDGGKSWTLYNSLAEALEASKSADTIIEVLKDVKMGKSIDGLTGILRSPEGKDYTVTINATNNFGLKAKSNQTLTVENIKIQMGTKPEEFSGVLAAFGGRILVKEGAEIQGTVSTVQLGAALLVASGSAEMTGGRITGGDGENGNGVVIYFGSFTMTGGEITGNEGKGILVYGAKDNGTTVNSTLNLSGDGEITGNTVGNIYLLESGATLRLVGDFTGTAGVYSTTASEAGQAFGVNEGDYTGAGRFFNDAIPSMTGQSANGKLFWRQEAYVASWGDDTNGDGTREKPYKTLYGAVVGLGGTGSGSTILTGKSATVYVMDQVSFGDQSIIVVDGTLTIMGDPDRDPGQEVRVTDNRSVTTHAFNTQNDGHLILRDVIFDGNGRMTNGFFWTNTGTGNRLTIGPGAVITNFVGRTDITDGYGLIGAAGGTVQLTIELNGGQVINNTVSRFGAICLEGYNTNGRATIQMYVSGHCVVSGNVSGEATAPTRNVYSNGPTQLYLAGDCSGSIGLYSSKYNPGEQFATNSGNWDGAEAFVNDRYRETKGQELAAQKVEGYLQWYAPPVARVNNGTGGAWTEYTDLATAINSLGSGDTVEILRDISLTGGITVSGKTFTLRSSTKEEDTGRTYTVQVAASAPEVDNNTLALFHLTDSANVTVQNIIIDGNKENRASTSFRLLYLDKSAQATLGDGAVLQNNMYNGAYTSGAVVVMSGCQLNVEEGAVLRWNVAPYGAAITLYPPKGEAKVVLYMSGGEIYGNYSTRASTAGLTRTDGGVVYVGDENTMVMSGGTITGNGGAFWAGLDLAQQAAGYAGGSLKLSGDAVITGNYRTTQENITEGGVYTSGEPANVYLCRETAKGYDLTLAGNFTGAAGLTQRSEGTNPIDGANAAGTQFGVNSGTFTGAENFTNDVNPILSGETKDGKLVWKANLNLYVATEQGQYQGSDVTGDGTRQKPFATLYGAFSKVGGSDATIFVMDEGVQTGAGQIYTKPNQTLTIQKAPGIDGPVSVESNSLNSGHLFGIYNASKLVIDDVTFDGMGVKRNGFVWLSGGSTLEMKNGAAAINFVATSYGIIGDNNSANNQVILSDAAVTGNTVTTAGVIYLRGSGSTVTLSGDTTITGNSRNGAQEANLCLARNDQLSLGGDFTGTVGVTITGAAAGEQFGLNNGSYAGGDRFTCDTDADLTSKTESGALVWEMNKPDVYVSINGVDAPGRGTPDKPYKTLLYAYGKVANNGSIHVMTADVPTAAAGGYVNNMGLYISVNKNVTITNKGEGETVYSDASLCHNNGNAPILLSLYDFTTTFESVDLTSAGKALTGYGKADNALLDVRGGSVVLEDCAVSGHYNAGTANGRASLDWSDGTLRVAGGSLTLTDVEVTGNTTNGAVYMLAGSVTLNGTTTFSGNTKTGSAATDIYLGGANLTLTLGSGFSGSAGVTQRGAKDGVAFATGDGATEANVEKFHDETGVYGTEHNGGALRWRKLTGNTGDFELLTPDRNEENLTYTFPNAVAHIEAGEDGTDATFKNLSVMVDTGSFTLGNLTMLPSGYKVSGVDANGNYVTSVSTGVKYTYLIFTGEFTPTDGEEVGTAAEFLRSITFHAEGYDVPQRVDVDADVINLPAGTVRLGSSYYQYVAQRGVNWNTAYAAAKGSVFNGLPGYLITVTSATEHNFVYQTYGGVNGWMGGVRTTLTSGFDGDTFNASANPGNSAVWKWVCGPEAGSIFWNGYGSSAGYRVEGMYTNWKSGEPNNASGEWAAQYGYGTGGRWNDYRYDNTGIGGYFIEYTAYQESMQAESPMAHDDQTNVFEWHDMVAVILEGGSNVSGKSYETLTQALADYTSSATQVIQMIADTTEDTVVIGAANLTRGRMVNLDLNGHNVNANIQIESGYTLYGMDSTTDGYSFTTDQEGRPSYGRIIGEVTGAGTLEDLYQTTAAQTQTAKRYVQIEEEGEGISFHRYNVSVTRYTFHISMNYETSDLTYYSTIRGDAKVLEELTKVGGSAKFGTGASVEKTIDKPNDIVSGSQQGIKIDEIVPGEGQNGTIYTTAFYLKGMLKFGEIDAWSLEKTKTMLGLMKEYYATASADMRELIDGFVAHYKLEEQWAALG